MTPISGMPHAVACGVVRSAGYPNWRAPNAKCRPLSKFVAGIGRVVRGEERPRTDGQQTSRHQHGTERSLRKSVTLVSRQGQNLNRAGKQSVRRRVDFNQGVDARILAKSPMFLREMATICISPLRIAFDHLGVRKVYEIAIRMAG